MYGVLRTLVYSVHCVGGIMCVGDIVYHTRCGIATHHETTLWCVVRQVYGLGVKGVSGNSPVVSDEL